MIFGTSRKLKIPRREQNDGLRVPVSVNVRPFFFNDLFDAEVEENLLKKSLTSFVFDRENTIILLKFTHTKRATHLEHKDPF
jgi:hypothetical protein